MPAEPIVFYDIPGNEPKRMAWSPNTWKTRCDLLCLAFDTAPHFTNRYTLNYKGLAYKTEWVEYPDVEAVCKKLGALATEKKPDGRLHYTLPVIYDPSTKAVVADSAEIAKYLDQTYPNTPRLFPDGTLDYQAVFLDVVRPLISMPLLQILLSRICGSLNEPSAVYFRKTREEAFGKTLEELNTEEMWQKFEQALERLKGYYDANGAGKDLLLMGDRVSFCDLQIASLFVWAKVITGEDSQDWKRIIAFQNGKWVKFMEQFRAYETVEL